MGLQNLALISPCDFLCEEAKARARAGVAILESAQVFEKLAEAIADCVNVFGFSSRKRDLNLPFLSVDSAFQTITEKTALVFGNETNGLSNAELQHCTRQVFIPTADDFSSLNLAAAVQIAAFEVFKAQQNHPIQTENRPSRANAAEREHLIQSFITAMEKTGFYNPDDPGRLIFRLCRLFNRADLEKTEAQILEGFLQSLATPTLFRGKK